MGREANSANSVENPIADHADLDSIAGRARLLTSSMRWRRRWVLATQDETRRYDRDFLLSPTKRNELVELWEVEKYGRDCFNDPDHVHLYGLPPKAWYAGVSASWRVPV